MPLAFDLISTLVMGSILPVATTDLTIVPFSTVAMRAGSKSACALFMLVAPYAPPATTRAPMPHIRRLRDFFMTSFLHGRHGPSGLTLRTNRLTDGSRDQFTRRAPAGRTAR